MLFFFCSSQKEKKLIAASSYLFIHLFNLHIKQEKISNKNNMQELGA